MAAQQELALDVAGDRAVQRPQEPDQARSPGYRVVRHPNPNPIGSDGKRACSCGCGRRFEPYTRSDHQHIWFSDACRKRWERKAIKAMLAEARGPLLPLVAPEGWSKTVRGTIAELVRRGRTFTSDDVRERCPDPPSPAAWGAIFQHALRDGLIVDSGRSVRSRLPGSRGRKVTEYLPGVIS